MTFSELNTWSCWAIWTKTCLWCRKKIVLCRALSPFGLCLKSEHFCMGATTAPHPVTSKKPTGLVDYSWFIINVKIKMLAKSVNSLLPSFDHLQLQIHLGAALHLVTFSGMGLRASSFLPHAYKCQNGMLLLFCSWLWPLGFNVLVKLCICRLVSHFCFWSRWELQVNLMHI